MIRHHENRSYRHTTERRDGRIRHLFSIGCARCPAILRLALKPDFPCEAVAQKFRNRGWRFSERNARDHLCPDCIKAGKAPAVSENEVATMSKTEKALLPVPFPDSPLILPRAATMPEVRRILALVEGHFDEAKGCYLGGYDDERVAQELDLPRAMVAKVRDESGLVLKPSPELLALAAEIKAMGAMLDDLQVRVATIIEQVRR